MTDIERRIRIEQEWAHRNVIADHLNDQRYEAYNWRRDSANPDWELGGLNWSVPHWKEPMHEIYFELDWDSLRASSEASLEQCHTQKARQLFLTDLLNRFRERFQTNKFFYLIHKYLRPH